MDRKIIKVGAVLLILFGMQWLTPYFDAYYLQIFHLACINAIMAISLNLVIGHTGQFSLGHAGFMAIGAYLSAAFSQWFLPIIADVPIPLFLQNSITILLALGVGGLFAAIFGMVVGIPTLRLQGDYLAIVTLGFSEIVRIAILNIDFLGGARGLGDIPELANFFWITSILICGIWFLSRLTYSLKGLSFLAIREDEIAARSVGIDVARYKIKAFVIAAFWAGIGGGLFAHLNTYLHTNSFGFIKSIEFVTMVVLGGLGSVTGSLLAAFLLTILPEFLRVASEWRMIFYSVLLIVMMILRPQGFLGKKEFRFLKKI